MRLKILLRLDRWAGSGVKACFKKRAIMDWSVTSPVVVEDGFNLSERLGYGSWAVATMSRPLRRSEWMLCVAAAVGGDTLQQVPPRCPPCTMLGERRTDLHKYPVEGA